VLSSPGFPPISVVPSQTQLPAGAGTQGIGVRTPSAADVAEATVGLAIDVHIPHGVMFVMGAQSVIVAAGAPPISTVACEAMSCPVCPIVQTIEAPLTTGKGIFTPPPFHSAASFVRSDFVKSIVVNFSVPPDVQRTIQRDSFESSRTRR
jgi:hypothetical protein